MRVHLLNSAVITAEGIYESHKISVAEFIDILKKSYEDNKLINYIGYDANIRLIAELADIRLKPNRNELINPQSGDIMLIMKLKYRLADVSKKSNPQFQDKLTEQDFEFMLVKYDNIVYF